MVEFAFVVPFVALLILGAVDFGNAYETRSAMLNLANQAGRYAEVNSCAPCNGTQSIEHYVASLAGNNLQGSSGWLPYVVSKVGLPTTSGLSAQAIVRIESPYTQPPSSNANSQMPTSPACST